MIKIGQLLAVLIEHLVQELKQANFRQKFQLFPKI